MMINLHYAFNFSEKINLERKQKIKFMKIVVDNDVI